MASGIDVLNSMVRKNIVATRDTSGVTKEQAVMFHYIRQLDVMQMDKLFLLLGELRKCDVNQIEEETFPFYKHGVVLLQNNNPDYFRKQHKVWIRKQLFMYLRYAMQVTARRITWAGHPLAREHIRAIVDPGILDVAETYQSKLERFVQEPTTAVADVARVQAAVIPKMVADMHIRHLRGHNSAGTVRDVERYKQLCNRMVVTTNRLISRAYDAPIPLQKVTLDVLIDAVMSVSTLVFGCDSRWDDEILTQHYAFPELCDMQMVHDWVATVQTMDARYTRIPGSKAEVYRAWFGMMDTETDIEIIFNTIHRYATRVDDENRGAQSIDSDLYRLRNLWACTPAEMLGHEMNGFGTVHRQISIRQDPYRATSLWAVIYLIIEINIQWLTKEYLHILTDKE